MFARPAYASDPHARFAPQLDQAKPHLGSARGLTIGVVAITDHE
jgi:hypothetical protein